MADWFLTKRFPFLPLGHPQRFGDGGGFLFWLCGIDMPGKAIFNSKTNHSTWIFVRRRSRWNLSANPCWPQEKSARVWAATGLSKFGHEYGLHRVQNKKHKQQGQGAHVRGNTRQRENALGAFAGFAFEDSLKAPGSRKQPESTKMTGQMKARVWNVIRASDRKNMLQLSLGRETGGHHDSSMIPARKQGEKQGEVFNCPGQGRTLFRPCG